MNPIILFVYLLVYLSAVHATLCPTTLSTDIHMLEVVYAIALVKCLETTSRWLWDEKRSYCFLGFTPLTLWSFSKGLYDFFLFSVLCQISCSLRLWKWKYWTWIWSHDYKVFYILIFIWVCTKHSHTLSRGLRVKHQHTLQPKYVGSNPLHLCHFPVIITLNHGCFSNIQPQPHVPRIGSHLPLENYFSVQILIDLWMQIIQTV